MYAVIRIKNEDASDVLRKYLTCNKIRYDEQCNNDIRIFIVNEPTEYQMNNISRFVETTSKLVFIRCVIHPDIPVDEDDLF